MDQAQHAHRVRKMKHRWEMATRRLRQRNRGSNVNCLLAYHQGRPHERNARIAFNEMVRREKAASIENLRQAILQSMTVKAA